MKRDRLGSAAVQLRDAADAPGQGRGGLAGQQTPLPVAALGAGDVGAVVQTQLQIVLHLGHKQPGHGAHAAPDDAPVEALPIVEPQVFPGIGDVLRRGLVLPQGQGAVVVGAGVAHAVLRVGVGR